MIKSREMKIRDLVEDLQNDAGYISVDSVSIPLVENIIVGAAKLLALLEDVE